MRIYFLRTRQLEACIVCLVRKGEFRARKLFNFHFGIMAKPARQKYDKSKQSPFHDREQSMYTKEPKTGLQEGHMELQRTIGFRKTASVEE